MARGMMRRQAAAGVLALALSGGGSTASAFVLGPSKGGLRSKAPRTPAVRPLQMAVGGPRGRSGGAPVRIEGADGSRVVVASAMPIEGISQQPSLTLDGDGYEDSDMVEGAMGAAAGMQQEDYQGFTGGQQRRTTQMVDPNSREATLTRKNKLLFGGLVVATVTAGVWVTGTAFVNRQKDLVEAFADEMTYHIGDEKEMELCIKEYKGKLGPAMYREAMFKECMLAVGRKKAVTLETVRSVKFIFKQFRLSPLKGVKLVVAATRRTDRSQSNVRSKLLFLGGLVAEGDSKAQEALEPLRQNVQSSFPVDGANMLKIKERDMAESALRAAISDVPEGEMLESGWEELGMDDQWAARVATDMVDNDEPAGGLDFYKAEYVAMADMGKDVVTQEDPSLRSPPATGGPPTGDAESDPEAAKALAAMEEDMAAKKTEPQDEKEPEPEGTAKAYECTVCGYKMFVAKGREFKFFGDDFKCPECGAGKNKFLESSMDDD